VGYGANNFYYLRHDSAGVSTFGTVFVTGLATRTLTDRFTVGTNAHELTFTTTDVGFGPNLFYFLRGAGSGSTNTGVITTNTVTTITTNIVPVFASVTASGTDICQARTVSDTARCSASGDGPVIGGPGMAPTSFSNGTFRLSFATQAAVSYVVQYKNSLSDALWTDLQAVTGTG
jgi:hypothetical protein